MEVIGRKVNGTSGDSTGHQGSTEGQNGVGHNKGEDGEKLKTGVPSMLKYVSLVVLTLQSAVCVLVIRYNRTRPGDVFYPGTAVVVSETIKVLSSLFIISIQEGSIKKLLKYLHNNIISQPIDCVKVAVPSIVYTLQNNLIYVAVSNLDAATFQVTYQLKILTTALMSVIILGKKLSLPQWISLVILFIGVSCVQMQPQDSKVNPDSSTEQQPLVGLVAVLVCCLMSGFAGVYFEKILKGSKQTLWLRNVQLGMIGVLFGYITMEIQDGDKIRTDGFFFGYDILVWVMILIQASGGLMVAVVVKYTDNILKGFAASAAIVLSSIASMYFFDFKLTLPFLIGALLVIASVWIYGTFLPSSANTSKKKS